MTELWIAYKDFDDWRGLKVSAVFLNELEARRFAADEDKHVAKIEPGIEITEQVK